MPFSFINNCILCRKVIPEGQGARAMVQITDQRGQHPEEYRHVTARVCPTCTEAVIKLSDRTAKENEQ